MDIEGDIIKNLNERKYTYFKYQTSISHVKQPHTNCYRIGQMVPKTYGMSCTSDAY
jgi:hypothetical protein